MSKCLVCEKPVEKADQVISGGQYLYEDEGEWVCSDECLESLRMHLNKQNED